jgi:hypothetical protein
MTNTHILLDAFADARRTWDDIVGLQPDVISGSRELKQSELVELERRIYAHQEAMDALADAISSGSVDDEQSLTRH